MYTKKQIKFWIIWNRIFIFWSTMFMITGVLTGVWWSAVLQAFFLLIFILLLDVWNRRLDEFEKRERIRRGYFE